MEGKEGERRKNKRGRRGGGSGNDISFVIDANGEVEVED